MTQQDSPGTTAYPKFIANPSFVQRRSPKGNFELVAADKNYLYELSRANGDKKPWTQKAAFGDISGIVAGVSLIEGPFGDPGSANLELVINDSGTLKQYHRAINQGWSGATEVADTVVVGVPSLIQTKIKGGTDNFEVIAAAEGGGLVQFERFNQKKGDNDKYPWSKPAFFAQSLGVVTSVSAIQGPYNDPGNIELVVIAGNKLYQLVRVANPKASWSTPGPFLTDYKVTGNPSLIQSSFGKKGNFELVVPSLDGGLLHSQRNNDVGTPAPWGKPTEFGKVLGIVTGVALIQGDLGPSSNNLEVIANAKGVLQQFHLAPGQAWSGPVAVGS